MLIGLFYMSKGYYHSSFITEIFIGFVQSLAGEGSLNMGSILGVPIALAVTFFSNKTADVWTWYKWMITYIYIKILQRQTKPRFDLYDFDAFDDPYKVGVLPPEIEMKLESPHDELDLNESADEVLFYGVNSSSECFVARVSRICSSEADVGLYVKLRNGKTYQLENVNCRHQTSKPSNKMFVGGGLKMHYQEPMRKWRIFYKGLLREFSGNDETSSRLVYVKLGLQWRASTDCFDTLSDINCSDLASALVRSKWKGFLPDITKFHNAVNAYYQGGVIRGEIYIDGTDKATELYVFGEKMRYLGNAPTIEGYRFSKLLGNTTKNGRLVHITELHIPGIVQNFMFGHIVTPEGKIETATKIDIKRHLSNEASLNVSFYADELDFNLTSSVDENSPVVDFGKEPDYTLSISDVELDMNSRSGRGVYIKMYTSKPQKKRIPKCTMQSSILKDVPLTVDFSSDICQIPDITGGKGSSLGKLTQLSKQYQNFIVPNGIVVTTSAYEKFITEDILKEIKNLENVLYGNAPGDAKIVSERVMNAVIQTELPKDVEVCIADHLKKEFSADTYDQKMFAIRSSATGEDSEEMSAAGQMETFLGVRKLDQILLSVKKCWASQFSYVSVQYKRQNGQELNTPMAVVIQEMVLCEVAGVLFTCDPLTGNPTVLTITANYGLGESVVSGSEEPDTVILERNPDESLGIKEKVIGAKSHRIIIKDETGPIQEDVPEPEREECALSDKLSLRLGKIALYIEKCYGSERDIEWGYLNDIFYIFQSRPVTSNNEETDYEIDHENDAPIKVENEYFTKCNVGEVMPGATSPLGIDVNIKFFNTTIQRKDLRIWDQFSSKYCLKGLVTMYNHAIIFAIDIFKFIGDGKSTMAQSQMIGLFGRVVQDEELFEAVRERFHKKTSIFEMLKKMFPMLFQMFTSYGILKRTKKRYENNLSWNNYRTSADLLKAILYSCTYPTDALRCHIISTNKSSLANMLLLSLLRKAKGEIDTDVYNDLSEILSCTDEVESAEVPAAMESLAYLIGKDKSPAEFQNMPIEEAENWLMTSTSDSGQMFRDFLKKHGHRCLKEFDVRTPTWGENPKQLIKLLQNLTKSASKDRVQKTTKSFHELLSKLKTPLSWKDKMLLKYVLLPMSRNGVQSREASKSMVVRSQNEWRKGYKKLAKLMVSEGRLPDGDLLFFMSVLEIQELLSSRCPKIISRAVHRRRRHQVLDGYIFPKMCSGIPKPVNTDDSEIINNDEYFSMKGMPVSQGVAKGFARVALNLDEASFLKPGEILITYSTDIGWSPYFPALGGVVTELGGLISHGAVVSREYGLPCIAGLHGATRQFHTGDYVLLDANKGILQKLPSPE